MLGLRTASFREDDSPPSNLKLTITDRSHNSTPGDQAEKAAMEASQSQLANPSLHSQKSAQTIVSVRDVSEARSEETSETQIVETASHYDKLTMVSEASITIRRRLIESIEEVDGDFYEKMTFKTFLDFVTRERLTRMPHRGSTWDRVLKHAEYFGVQVQAYGESVSGFVRGSDQAISTALGNAKLLLEMGPSQDHALEPAFNTFYRIGLLLSFFWRNRSLYGASEQVRAELGGAFAGLVHLVGDVAIYYRKRLDRMSSTSVRFDFNGQFGNSIIRLEETKDRIADIMWAYNLRKSRFQTSVKIATLRDWLVPSDDTVRLLTDSKKVDKADRTEYTCEWFQRHLLDFLRSDDRSFSVNGTIGCGKSVLTDWMEERLQRPLGKKFYETISFAFESDIPGELTARALLKNLIMQLLDRNIGDMKLFESLVKAYELSLQRGHASNTNDVLFAALRAGLKTLSDTKVNVIVIVDGLDKVTGTLSGKDLVSRLHEVTAGLPFVRSVFFSRDAPAAAKTLRQLAINVDHTHDDIRRFFNVSLQGHSFFSHFTRESRVQHVDNLLRLANGSFLWAALTLAIILAADNEQAFVQAIEKPKKSVDDAAKQVIHSVDFGEQDIKRIVSWSLVSERPLTVPELTELLHIDLQKKERADRKLAMRDLTLKLSKSLMITTNGILRFRHAFIRATLLKIAGTGKAISSKEEIESKLTQRLLFYIRLCIESKSEPSLELVEGALVHDLFHKHRLLEYSIRYWCKHFKDSNLHFGEGPLTLGADFKSLFPSSSLLTKLEWACWGSQMTISEVLRFHHLALRIRQSVFGERHECVLQSHIVIGTINRHICDYEAASAHFYHASVVAKYILTTHSSIITACTTTFLACVEFVTIVTRTEIATYKEEMLKFMIEICIHQHGRTSDIVIRYYRMLAKFHISVHEEHSATVIYHQLYEIIILRFGKTSHEAREMSDELMVILQKEKKSGDLHVYTKSFFETCEETMEIWDVRRIKITLELAWSYELRGEIELAEEMYIELWQQITEICITRKTTEILILKFDIAFAYVEFLRRCKRIEEASAILICIWEEHQHDHLSELIILKLKFLGTIMRSIGLLEIAINIFTSVWRYFKKQNKCSHEEALSVTVLISETVEEIITMTTTTTVTTMTKTEKTTITTVSETLLIEIFETSLAHIVAYKAWVQVIKTCNALVSMYLKLQLWSKAISILTRTLEVMWKDLVEVEGKCSLPSEYRVEVILISLRFAQCYHHQGNFEVAERYYLRIYWACASLKVTDEYFQQVVYALIEFYESYHRHEKAIYIYEELLERYRRDLGVKHTLTITLLYKLGGLCVKYGRKDGYKYYIEIVTTLNKGSHDCHHDAFEAVIILSKYYYEEHRWEKCHEYSKLIWAVICHGDLKHAFDETFVLTFFNRYMTVCRYHLKLEFQILRKVTEEYREITIKLFGANASITIEALIQLAMILELREEFYHEAIAIYEEVIKKTTKTVTTTTTTTTITTTTSIETVRKRVVTLYVTVIKSSKCSHETITRAITLCEERLLELKMQLGCYHAETLEILMELTLLYISVQSRSKSIHLLQTYFLEIITHYVAPYDLFHAAITIAAIYTACGLVEQGLELSKKIRRIIIVQDITLLESFNFKCDHGVGKSSYIFIVAFEETLRGRSEICYTEVMADILIETILYEKFTHTIRVKEEAEIIIVAGARLRRFLIFRKRSHQVKVLDEQLLSIFLGKWGSCLSVKESTKSLLLITLVVRIGMSRRHQSMSHIACVASDTDVRELLQKKDFEKAYELATALFQFIDSHKAYYERENFGYSFKLSLHLAGRDVPRCPEKKLEEQMIQLSRTVIRLMFEACKHHNIDLVSLSLDDLSNLIVLLGEQKNYSDLEYLLTRLWDSRHQQVTWKEETVLAVGRALVQSRYLHGHHSAAISLAEDIAYNLRRAKGSLQPATLDAYNVLSELYSAHGSHREAMGIHEEILRLVIDDANSDDDGFEGVDEEVGQAKLASVVKTHLTLLKGAFARAGEWDRSRESYVALYERLAAEFGGESKLGVPPLDKWKKGDAGEKGVFRGPETWAIFTRQAVRDEKKDVVKVDKKKNLKESHGWLRRISSYYGMDIA